jgi:hypothetical protein
MRHAKKTTDLWSRLGSPGYVEPGLPIGALHVNTTYSQGLASHLQIEIGGTTAGTQYDQLLVTGTAFLDGTLDVSSINSFMPQRGNTFSILDFSTSVGKFATLNLPSVPASLGWDTSELYTSGLLSVQLLDDFNHDGTVDAADYVRWRMGLDSIYTQTDYNVWRTHFGQSAGSGSSVMAANSAVPEPRGAALVLMTAFFCMFVGRWERKCCSSTFQ